MIKSDILKYKHYVDYFTDIILYCGQFSIFSDNKLSSEITSLKNNQVRGLYNVAISYQNALKANEHEGIVKIKKFAEHQKEKVKNNDFDAGARLSLWNDVLQKIVSYTGLVNDKLKELNWTLGEGQKQEIIFELLKEYIKCLYFEYLYKKSSYVAGRRY